VEPPYDPNMDTQRLAPDPELTETLDEEDGQGMVEYAFIIMFIAIVVLLAVQVLGHVTNNLYSNISNGFNQ
jgi:pilus assembly protein Flp/PilA